MQSPVVVNGVNGATGAYLMPPLTTQRVTALARGESVDQDHLGELRWWHRRVTEAAFGPRYGIDPKDLAQAGWGVVFAHDADPAVREALRELLDHRRAQASAIDERRYKEFTGSAAYRPGESKQAFLARQGAGPGPADPDRVPYYLMLVGDPDRIPYEFQYQLDVQYAVGRLDLDSPEDFATYARAVVAAETASAPHAERRLALFATSNPDDPATQLSASELALPLAGTVAERATTLRVDSPIMGEAATKAALTDLLARDPPAVLFTATHGIGFPCGDPRQPRHQGALVCQEWPGPEAAAGPVPVDHYFSADDVPDGTDLSGVVAFHFACFGAGTPLVDGFSTDGGQRRRLADRPFTASLPKRLLSQSSGPALAVVGHVDRAWGYSFSWPGVGSQTEALAGSVLRLADGHPVGSAFEQVNEKYAELSTMLSQELEDVKYGKRPNELLLASLWTAHNDARNVVILGDPAVRLHVPPSEAGRDGARSSDEADVRETRVPAGAVDARPDQPGAAAVPPSEELDYGMFDSARRARQRIAEGVAELARSVQTALEETIQSVAALEVVTAEVDDLSASTYDRDTRQFTGSKPRIVSRVAIGGTTDVVVARQRSADEEALWKLHLEMVDRATAARAELIRTASSALAALLDAVKLV